ncbi:MAG: hypothetical protein KDD64_11015 [Bdellovibrionales bacterium]|nr:hypothetical protein [Bdellovibrionales bacterium]
MKPFSLALSYLRIPKLFVNLFLFPLLLSLLVVFVQLVATGLFLKGQQTRSNYSEAESRIESLKMNNLGRRILFGDQAPFASVAVCRWKMIRGENGKAVEVPPSEECNPDRLDVAIRTSDVEAFDPKDYMVLLKGNVERLHICETCSPDVVIDVRNSQINTEISSVYGAILFSLLTLNEEVSSSYVEMAQSLDFIKRLTGKLFFFAPGFRGPVRVSNANVEVSFLFSIAFLIVIAMYLAMKAHRKVLEYFSRSGALLPMVASIGKRNFYSAIWILTLFRVGAFVVASVPMLLMLFLNLDDEGLGSLLDRGPVMIVLWLLALCLSFGLATLIASIADLKQRHQALSFFYRYVPLILCLAGISLWGLTLLSNGSGSGIFRNIIACIPILGTGPILIGPIFQPPMGVFLVHALLTFGCALVLLRYNVRWFAAHLEQL